MTAKNAMSHKKEYIVALVVVGLLLLLHNPFMFWMPGMIEMTLSLLLCIVVVVFGIFLWRERAADEREQLHIFIADRAALLGVGAVLTIATLFQGVQHRLDPWVGLSLAVMIAAKAAGLWYSRRKH